VSRAAPATEAELRAAFDALLTGPPDEPTPSDTGLDELTLDAVARAHAGTSPALVEAARQELELQIDGTHASEGDVAAMLAFAAVLTDTPAP
jgi:hypothetical protein